jgi:hypothetical protein
MFPLLIFADLLAHLADSGAMIFGAAIFVLYGASWGFLIGKKTWNPKATT